MRVLVRLWHWKAYELGKIFDLQPSPPPGREFLLEVLRFFLDVLRFFLDRHE